MKKTIIVIMLSFFLIISLGIAYVFFKGGTWFVSSIDGDNVNSNYTSIVNDYYLMTTEKTICLNTNNSYERITSKIDSLSWSPEVIVGYSQNKYFKIIIATRETNYFNHRDSLFQAIQVIPSFTLPIIPGINPPASPKN